MTLAIVLIIVLGIFAIGVAVGIVAVVSLGVRQEDLGPLSHEGPDRLTRGARRLTGLYVRQERPAPWGDSGHGPEPGHRWPR
jgi:hypothetical protein